ncbi:putative RNA-directed DNA polymerase from transposon BS [Trichonephila clavipes]|nr:putative RNA-directed DNA polymerase from transposon BS [Trichonephila clavipes]
MRVIGGGTAGSTLVSYCLALAMLWTTVAYDAKFDYAENSTLGECRNMGPESSSSRHIDHLVHKSRKRLSILKYIFGRGWGADSFTNINTYLALIKPILEYCYPIYSCVSKTNLQKLERVQLSAACTLTGFHNSCPSDNFMMI